MPQNTSSIPSFTSSSASPFLFVWFLLAIGHFYYLGSKFTNKTLHTAKFHLENILWGIFVISAEASIKAITFVSNRIECATMVYILLLLLFSKETTQACVINK